MIRAIAVATDTSDVVGTVELSCEPMGLSLRFVRAAAFAASYVPSLPARGARAIVPWAAIRGVADDGETLRLSLDAPHVPHRRLVLAHFTRDHRRDHTLLHRQRRRAQLVAAGAAALLASSVVPLATSALTTFGATLLSAIGVFSAVIGATIASQAVGRRVMLGGAEEMAERRAFFFELRSHLPSERVVDEAATALGPAGPQAVSPSLSRPFTPTPAPTVSPWQQQPAAAPSGFLREVTPTLAAVAASAFVALLALFVGGKLLSAPIAPTQPSTQAESASLPAGVAPASSREILPDPAPPPLPACLCDRPVSPAIPQRLPRVSFLPRIERANLDPRRPSIALEVAAVNNTGHSLRDVQGQVVFTVPALRDGDPPRVRAERGIYYEGPLLAGGAIKWRVKGRGTSFHISTQDAVPIDDGQIAPADAFAKLLDARTRSVRIHGAMMLARMRDQRATEAIARLREDATDDEASTLTSLGRAAAPVFVCDVELTTDEDGRAAVSACAMNSTEDESGPLEARVSFSADAAGEDGITRRTVIAEAPLRKRFTLAPRTGGRLSTQVELPAVDGQALLTEVIVDAR